MRFHELLGMDSQSTPYTHNSHNSQKTNKPFVSVNIANCALKDSLGSELRQLDVLCKDNIRILSLIAFTQSLIKSFETTTRAGARHGVR